MPASALNKVVLPVLGLPTKATVGLRGSMGQETHGDSGRFITTQTESEITQADLHGVAKRGKAQDFEFFSLE